MLMLLCVHVTRVLFLVLAGNSALTMASIGVTRSYSSCLFLCALERRLSSENNFADVSAECSSRLQGESERSVKQRCYL